MTVEEKVGQVIQPDIDSVTPEDMRRYHFGAVLNGGDSSPDKDEFAPPEKWLALADAFYEASVDRSNGGVGIPSIWGTDAVHGDNNIIGATLFPQNIGAGRDARSGADAGDRRGHRRGDARHRAWTGLSRRR